MCFSEGIVVSGRQVRGHCELLRGVRLHGGALPHRHQEPRPGHLLPSGQAGGHHRPAARPAQGDDDDDDDDDGDDDQVYWLPAPVFIMGVVAAVAGGLAVLFPETLGETLPETAEEAARWATRHHWYGLILDVLQYRVRQQARAVHLHMLQHQGALRRGAQGSGQYGDGEGGDNHVDITFLH